MSDLKRIVEEMDKKYAGEIPLKELEDILGTYQRSVKNKIDLLFECIKLNSGGGSRGIEMREACQWVDATQNLLVNLFMMLQPLEENGMNLTKDFIKKVIGHLEAILNEGK